MKYLTIPAPADIRNPSGQDPSAVVETVPFAKAVRIVAAAIVQKQALPALEVIDLRDKVARAQEGDVVELTEPEYAALREHFEKPTALSPIYVLEGGEGHIRAVMGATDKRPAPLVSPA